MKKNLVTVCFFLILTACTATKESTLTTTDEISSPDILTSENSNIDDEYLETNGVEVTTLNSGGFTVNRSYAMGTCETNNCQSIIDTESLQILSYYYAKDKNHLYYTYLTNDGKKYEIIQDLDPSSFEVVGNTYFSKDKNGVYFIWWGKTLNISVVDADTKTFTAFEPAILGISAKDSKHLFTYPGFKNGKLSCLIEGADASTFKDIGGGWQKDKSHIFTTPQLSRM